MNQIIQLVLPEGRVHSEWEWTYWATPCKMCRGGHYTFGYKDTQKHAEGFHPDYVGLVAESDAKDKPVL